MFFEAFVTSFYLSFSCYVLYILVHFIVAFNCITCDTCKLPIDSNSSELKKSNLLILIFAGNAPESKNGPLALAFLLYTRSRTICGQYSYVEFASMTQMVFHSLLIGHSFQFIFSLDGVRINPAVRMKQRHVSA